MVLCRTSERLRGIPAWFVISPALWSLAALSGTSPGLHGISLGFGILFVTGIAAGIFVGQAHLLHHKLCLPLKLSAPVNCEPLPCQHQHPGHMHDA